MDSVNDDCDLETLVADAADAFLEDLRAGRAPSIEQYAARFPQVGSVLRSVLPALSLLDAPDPQQDAADSLPMLGELGDYRIIRELGRGGMGVVYEANQISLSRRVALKVLPFAAMLDKQQLARFKNEARAAATLDHGNIVPIYSVGSERGVHYYAMRLIDGPSLAQVIAGLHEARSTGPQYRPEHLTAYDQAAADTVRDVVAALSTVLQRDAWQFFITVARYASQAAAALEHAHACGVLHRDIKPGNLLLDEEQTLWITDFGLAQVDAGASLTVTGDILGTLRYMSPEQAAGSHGRIDHRTDIYSLGVTLYELLTLKHPFPESDRHTLLEQLASAQPVRPRVLQPRIPNDLEVIVLKAMEKDPADRYMSAQEMAEDLRRFIAGQPIVAKPASSFQRLMKWSARNIRLVTFALAVAVALSAGLAATAALVGGAWKESENAKNSYHTQWLQSRRNLYLANIQLAHRDWQFGRVDLAAEKLKQVAPLRSEPDLRHWEWYYLDSLFSKAELRDSGTLARNTPGQTTPWVYERTGDLLVVRKMGERASALSLSNDWADERDVLVSPDSRNVLHFASRYSDNSYAEGTSYFELWSLPARQQIIREELPSVIRAAAFRPNGEYFATSHSNGEVALWNALTGKLVRRETLTAFGIIRAIDWSSDGSRIAIGGVEGRLGILDSNLKLVREIPAHVISLCSVAFNPDGTILASGSQNGEFATWDVATGANRTHTRPHLGMLEAIAWAPDGNAIATGGSIGVVKVWDKSGKLLNSLKGARASVAGVAWINSTTLAASSRGETAVWAAFAPQEYVEITTVDQHCWLPTSDGIVVVKRDDGQLRVQTIRTADGSVGDEFSIPFAEARNPKEKPWIASIDLDRSGKRLAVAGFDGNVTIWDLKTKAQLLAYHAHDQQVRSVAWSPDGKLIASAGGEFKVSRSDNGEVVATFDAGKWKFAGSVAWSPDGCHLATITFWGDASVWATKGWQQVHSFKDPVRRSFGTDGQRGIAWSPTGDRLATRHTGQVRVWDIETGTPTLSIPAHTANTKSIAWSPDGSRLATGSDDHTIRLWDASSGEELLTLGEHHLSVYSLAWSPDGRSLSSGSDHVRIWNARR